MLFSDHSFRHNDKKTGSIEVICGSMFSGKTEELIRRMKRAQLAGLFTEVFKPQIDIRYAADYIVSHDQSKVIATSVAHSSAILAVNKKINVVGIDEAQFFDDGLADVCIALANCGVRVIVAGLDMDYKARPFGPVPSLLAVAEHITKVHAVCVQCGAPANYSYRKKDIDDIVLLGEKDNYEPRCRNCYYTTKKG